MVVLLLNAVSATDFNDSYSESVQDTSTNVDTTVAENNDYNEGIVKKTVNENSNRQMIAV